MQQAPRVLPAAGDREGFAAFVTEHSPAVWSLVTRLTSSEVMAEEALQETFVAAWRGLGSYRGDSAPRAWVLGIARRHAARTWRRRAGEPIFSEPMDDEIGACAGWGSDPELAASRAEDREQLFAAMALLSPDDQEILSRCDLEGGSAAEAGRALDISANAARVRLHRARLRLMHALREGGFDG